MVNASKILTVSYGTFSCTLEGFDDPFSTMRSIAEYFRDLAADDRYFGAEPPTPDAEMLHRIAEREINRRVEAKVNKNGVVLRQLKDDRAPAPAHETADEAEPSQPAAAAGSQKAVSHADAPGATRPRDDASDVDARPMQSGAAESVAEKLRRIRAAVARSHVEPQLAGVFAEDEHASPLFDAGSIDTALAGDAADAEADEPEVLQDAEPEAPAIAAVDDAEAQVEVEVEVEAEAEAEPEAETEVAAEIEIEVEIEIEEEFVAESDAAEVDAELPAETQDLAGEPQEQPEDAIVASQEADDSDADASGDADSAEFFAAVADMTAPVGEEETDTLDIDEELLAEVSFADFDAAEPEADEVDADAAPTTEIGSVPEADEPDLSEEFDLDTLSARLADEDFVEAEEEPAPEASEFAADETAVAEPEEEEPAEAAFAAEPEQDAAAEVAEERQPDAPVVRARVVKMSRKDFMERYVEASAEDAAEDDATAQPVGTADSADSGDSEEVTPEKIRASLGETGLSPEDEDDLISELVAAERDANGDTEPQADETAADTDEGSEPLILGDAINVDATGSDAAEQTVEEIAATLKAAVDPIAKPTEELSVTRLLRQTDTELKNTDGSRRRSAIAHLKAAVAAVRADGGRGRDKAAAEDAKTMDVFRDDLARAVRPETGSDEHTELVRPRSISRDLAAGSADTQRTRRKMPPLMLVSEQRVDKPAAADPDAASVRPRRVQAEDEIAAEAEVDGGDELDPADDFGSFVAETEIEGVQDLLEASAAFGTLVEGQPFNSRPQIMQRMLRHVPEGTVTREEGLRAFGVLLREGRLIRIQRGQFVLPEDSRFRTEPPSAVRQG